jgi:hypothetical protein
MTFDEGKQPFKRCRRLRRVRLTSRRYSTGLTESALE